ncbi:MAG: glycosyltransferase [Amphritea sp.]|nr:glycosyltransferase [Amphritea sp.]
MNEMPLVSVIVPVYNGEKYLLEAINSVLSQTYSDFEIIVINDGSTDSSMDIVAAINSDKIRVVTNEQNIGLAATRNRGLKVAKGKYIALMDGDDISFPHRFEKQVEFLEQNPDIGLVSSNFITFEEDIESGKRSEKVLPTDSDFISTIIPFQNVICCPVAMFRSELVTEKGLFFNESLRTCEDWDMWYRISKLSGIANIDDYLIYYRKHGSNLSKKRALMHQNKMKIIQNSFSDCGIDVSDCFNEDGRIKGLEQYQNFVSLVEQFYSENKLSFAEEHLRKSCAYITYEIYKTNSSVLGGDGWKLLKKSMFYPDMDIGFKYRVKNTLKSIF